MLAQKTYLGSITIFRVKNQGFYNKKSSFEKYSFRFQMFQNDHYLF